MAKKSMMVGLTKKTSLKEQKLIKAESEQLFNAIAPLIDDAKKRVISNVNYELTMVNWHIGQHIANMYNKVTEVYGMEIVSNLSPLLTKHYGTGYTTSSIHRIHRFYKAFQNKKIITTLSQILTWSHFIELITVKEKLSREYYAELCRLEHWNVRDLRDKINSQLFERTILSKKPEKLIKQELNELRKNKIVSENIVFRDNYLLDFLQLKEVYSEKDLEEAILVELQKFILEIGTDFAFLSRQKRMQIDGVDFYLDLLFYHRGLNRLVAIELKLDKFKPSYKSQMELYLKWLEKFEIRPNEELPIGLILCADGNREVTELLMFDEKRIKVANYNTKFKEINLIKSKLKTAIAHAKTNLKSK